MPNETATPKLSVGSRVCQCPTCAEFFYSPTAFDAHRIGEIGVNRRCLTVIEMLADGMARNAMGFWTASAYTREDAA